MSLASTGSGIRQTQGFTLIETVIILSVVAILTAILVPLITQNIQSARVARAGADVATIGKAMVQFRQDTGKWPVSDGVNNMKLLYSDSDASAGIPSTWNTIAAADRLGLSYHLIHYNTTVQRGPSANGLPSWNGPYLSQASADPWGNAYLVDSEGLWPGNTGIVFVISAGPGRPASIETPIGGVPPSGSDDIGFRIQ